MEGLKLRLLDPKDLDFLIEVENDSQFWPLSHTTQPFSREDLSTYISNAHQSLSEAGQARFVISNPTGIPLGFVDLYDHDPQHKRAGVGVLVHPQWQRKRIGTQALELLMNQAKEHHDLHQLYALISPNNIKSRALFEKCSFEKSGLKKDWYFYADQYHDMWLYQKIMHV